MAATVTVSATVKDGVVDTDAEAKASSACPRSKDTDGDEGDDESRRGWKIPLREAYHRRQHYY
jgi:hypothetical protein